MSRLSSHTWHVMDSMADDWESIDQIYPHVIQFHGPTNHFQIFEDLRKLHQEGLILIMDEDGNEKKDFPKNSEKSWFSMTQLGRNLWDSEGKIYRKE